MMGYIFVHYNWLSQNENNKMTEVEGMFNISEEVLEKQQATNTTKEIRQQPQVWQELINGLRDRKEELEQFISSIYNKHDQVRVVFTGAGTSAFIGDILASELSKQEDEKVRFEAVIKTDIVLYPTD